MHERVSGGALAPASTVASIAGATGATGAAVYGL